MATFVVVHGAWLSGWAWKKMRSLLWAAGHEVFTPSLTGLGERSHLATVEVGLETHIQDIVNVLFYEDLRDVTLIAHSYGGIVATGVADRVSERIRQVIYLDAFVPRDGQSLADLAPGSRVAQPPASPDDWSIEPPGVASDTTAEDVTWIMERRASQPRKTFLAPVHLSGAVDRLPRAYIYCLQSMQGDVFRQFAARSQNEDGWRYEEIDARHNPNITDPQALAKILLRLTAD
jgi:pimeloyl-ACP methyl ester carboxylesterase